MIIRGGRDRVVMKEQERVAPAGTSVRLSTETNGTLPNLFIAGAMGLEKLTYPAGARSLRVGEASA